MNYSKLKYYKELCEKGIINEEQKNLDGIMNALEEKQFEYLKRLETTKDEERKDEINELLNTIDLQLKEVASLKAAISSGIIVESANEEKTAVQNDDKEVTIKPAEKKDINNSKERKKNKIGLIAAVIALIAVVAIGAMFVLNGKNDNSGTATGNDTATTGESASDEDENAAKIGLITFSAEECRQAWKEMGEEDDWDYLLDGLYISDITNQSMIDAGAQIGDRIITLNGENIKTRDDLANVNAKYKPGDEAILVVARGFEQVTCNGSFIRSSETLPSRDSGEEIVQIDGRPYRFAYSEDGLSINAWQFEDE